MTDEEKELEESLARIFRYCKSHENTCEGCIFFRQTQIGPIVFARCRVKYSPEFFQDEQ